MKMVMATLVLLMLNSTTYAQETPKLTEKKPTEVEVLEAKIIKLQLEYLELQKQFVGCQTQLVGAAAKQHEDKILKSSEAKPGQKFDWATFTLTPVPPVKP